MSAGLWCWTVRFQTIRSKSQTITHIWRHVQSHEFECHNGVTTTAAPTQCTRASVWLVSAPDKQPIRNCHKISIQFVQTYCELTVTINALNPTDTFHKLVDLSPNHYLASWRRWTYHDNARVVRQTNVALSLNYLGWSISFCSAWGLNILIRSIFHRLANRTPEIWHSAKNTDRILFVTTEPENNSQNKP